MWVPVCGLPRALAASEEGTLARISRESIEEVRRACDIVEIVHSHVPLKKKGASWWACCPFHDEKTPSFSVSPTRQTYKCFGCGAWGNVIDFVIQHEKLDFVQAVERLADRAGVRLQWDGARSADAGESRNLRARCHEMLEWAQRGYTAHLEHSEVARKYLHDRGLGGEVAQRWGIGFAPDEWTRLTDAARKRFPGDDEALIASGLARRNDNGRVFDFFRGRITFPIRDAQGRIVGFGARLLDPEAKAQKYVNSPEGPVFQKSSLLYGLDRLGSSTQRKATGRVLIMEGYTDVIAAHEAGFDNAVAPLGTAVTADQLRLLKRWAEVVVFVLDGDDAGQKAAERAVELALESGVDAQVAVVQGAKDPFDLLRGAGPRALQEVLDKARDAFEFRLELARQHYDFQRPVSAEAALNELASLAARAATPSLRELLGRRVAQALQLREAAVLARIAEASRGAARGKGETGPEAAATAPEAAAQRDLLARLWHRPALLATATEVLDPGMLCTAGLREAYREMLNAWDEHGELSEAAMLAHMGAQGRDELAKVLDLTSVPADHADFAHSDERLLEELRRLASPWTPAATGLNELRRRHATRRTERISTQADGEGTPIR
jgi:DNA primase